MLIRKQDVGVLLLYYLGYSRIRNLVLRLQRKAVARFVMFHDILPEAVGSFRDNVQFLKRRTNVVSLDDFLAGRLSSKKINVVITFDDGYKSWITGAIPLLKKLKLPATFFVSSGLVGLPKEDETEIMRSKLLIKPPIQITSGALSFEDVKKIAEEGFGVGGHTLTHCNLAHSRDIVQVRYEITEDKERLERLTGSKIEYFSYPFGGHHNQDINLIQILGESGYRAAVTTVSGFNCAKSDPFLLHRELTYAWMHGWVFRARAYGNYDAVRFLRQGILKSLFWT